MQYSVRAVPKTEQLGRLWKILNDGTVERQEPDGPEIVASMKRAVVTGQSVEWYETCFCNPPLNHERTTIYDQFFTGIQIQPEADRTGSPGDSFWQYLREQFESSVERGGVEVQITSLKHVPIRVL